MEHLKRFLRYLVYFFSSKSANSIHSPFVFDLYTSLILDKNPFYAFEKIEDLRLVLENDPRMISVTDFGAGLNRTPGWPLSAPGGKRIKSIAKNAATRAKYGQLLFRLVNRFGPGTILEIGTSLGLGTLYLAAPHSRSKVISLEGCPEISEVARLNFEKLKVKNIEQVVGNFDHTLPLVLEKISSFPLERAGDKPLDFVFFDGNHKKEPTLGYFSQCLKISHSETIFVFDDIHWSDEMDEAWREIKKNPEVKVTIDLFFLGIVFFRKELTKQDFVLRF